MLAIILAVVLQHTLDEFRLALQLVDNLHLPLEQLGALRRGARASAKGLHPYATLVPLGARGREISARAMLGAVRTTARNSAEGGGALGSRQRCVREDPEARAGQGVARVPA